MMRIWIQRILLTLGLLVVIGVSYFGVSYVIGVDSGERVTTVIIEPGDGFNKVAEILLDEGVVRSRTMLYFPARWRDIDKKLVPGRYDFTGVNSCRSVLDRLEKGDFLVVRVTIPEGAPIWRVASILARKLDKDSSAVMALNTDSSFLAAYDLPCLEGYLFPNTYAVPWHYDLETVVGEMVEIFRQQTDTVWTDTIPNGLSREEAVVLASIVEAEALYADEMPRIASVYHNRLRKKWRLDADPTVIYGLGGLDRPLNRRDLRQRTPYNTYRMRGLPPTPINSPRLAAIQAVLHPESTDYMFFVADGSGYHRFSKTNKEHNRARYEIRQSLQHQGR